MESKSRFYALEVMSRERAAVAKASFTISNSCAASALPLPGKKWNTGWPRPRNGRGVDCRVIINRLAQAGTRHRDRRYELSDPGCGQGMAVSEWSEVRALWYRFHQGRAVVQ
jgi:hypothetical protein